MTVIFAVSSFAHAAIDNDHPCKGYNLIDTKNKTGIFDDGQSLCTCSGGTNLDNNSGKCEGLKVADKTACTALASQGTPGKSTYAICYFQGNGDPTAKNTSPSQPNGAPIRNPNNATGTGIPTVDTMMKNAFFQGMMWILTQVLKFVSYLLAIAFTIFDWVIRPENISGPNNSGVLQKQAIKDVWIMVRDLLNMTFILVLLFSAFCTIFQVEKWNLKKVWLSILINALLVNFSYPIARIIIDISNVAFYYFVNNLFTQVGGSATGSSIFAMFGAKSDIGPLLQPQNYAQSQMPYLIAMIVILFIMGMTLLVLSVLFLIRIIALAMLIMFAPIGFVPYIFPKTAKYADDWWTNLFSYSFFAPIMIFIMAVALRITDAIGKENMQQFLISAGNNTTGDGLQPTWLANAAFLFIPIILLWGGMGVAKASGIAMADSVVKTVQGWSKKIGSAPFSYGKKWGWMGTKAAGRWADRKYLKDKSPRAILAAWNANAKAKEEKHLNMATGAWRDRMSAFLSGGQDKTHHKDAAFQAQVAKKQKDIGDVNQESEYLMSQYKNAMKRGKADEMAAILRIMFNNNDQNEFMKLQGQDVNPFKMKELIFKQLTDKENGGGMSHSDAAKQMADLSEIAVSKGNYANYGMASMNVATGQFEMSNDINQAKAAVGKASNVRAQAKTDSWHWNSFLTENADGTTGGLHEVGKAQLANLTRGELDNINRVRNDFTQRVGSEESIKEIRNFAKAADSKDAKGNILSSEQRAFIEEFADQLENMKKNPKKPK